ncbi:MAG: chorismate synthase [Deltaproteobacteria bacterium]|nr:chorismate synthase [Deltaproteobacteria bacterium]
MSGNTFGRLFRLTTFGESHGPALGGVIDGCPAGLDLDEAVIQRELDLRRPGQGPASTARKEPDTVRILSGVFEGRTTGTPIGFVIENTDQRSRDYSAIADTYRPGHGDLTYDRKYGVRDYRGGGRSSGRETVSRVAGGAVAQVYLGKVGVSVRACTRELGGIVAADTRWDLIGDNPFFSPDPSLIPTWEEKIRATRAAGDTLGGVVEIEALGVPPGLGEPVFDKLDARLAYALMGVGAVKGVEIGRGFEAARLTGMQNNDPITPKGFTSNNSGGILAGISNGDRILVRAAIKPIPSVGRPQQTVDRSGRAVSITVGGRHDICAIPRIVPVLKAMVLLTLADMHLLQFGPLNRP